MRVLFVASECVPFVKTGGLADVAGALPKALSKLGIDVRVLMPAYSSIRALIKAKKGVPVTVLTGTQAVIHTAEAEGLSLMLVDAPDLYDRPGNPYLAGNGRDWPDNHRRFGALARAAAAVANGKAGNWRPDIVHMHDWQAGLVPLYLREDAAKPASVFTIHNIAFQGLFESSVIGELGLPAQGFTFEGYEYFGKVSFLKAGLVHADAITTVSPTYAKELTSSEFGMGMEGLLASRQSDMTGILNGIDTEIWNPDKDFQIACTYNARSLARKARNTRVVEERFGIEPGERRTTRACPLHRERGRYFAL